MGLSAACLSVCWLQLPGADLKHAAQCPSHADLLLPLTHTPRPPPQGSCAVAAALSSCPGLVSADLSATGLGDDAAAALAGALAGCGALERLVLEGNCIADSGAAALAAALEAGACPRLTHLALGNNRWAWLAACVGRGREEEGGLQGLAAPLIQLLQQR